MCCDDILCRMCAVDARSVPPVPRVWGTPAALHQHNVQSLCAVRPHQQRASWLLSVLPHSGGIASAEDARMKHAASTAVMAKTRVAMHACGRSTGT